MRCSTTAVSLSEDTKVIDRRTRETQEGVNGAEIVVGWYKVDVNLHTDTNNFAPNEYGGVVNSSGLAVYKGSTQEINVELKVKTESKLMV